MRKQLFTVVLIFAVAVTAALSGCGTGSQSAGNSSGATVSGIVASDAPLAGTVTLRDSSNPPMTQSTVADASGNYSFDVSNLNAPFIMSAGTGTAEMYSFSTGTGTANINPFSTMAVAASAGTTDAESIFSFTPTMMNAMMGRRLSTMDALKSALAPLLQMYNISEDPISGDYQADSAGFSAMFKNITISVVSGTITITNKQTGATIFTAPVNNIPGGTFYPQNLPGATGSTPGSGSGSGSGSTPSACTYTYSVWGTCQSDGTQTRTMLTASPSGCTGTPVLTQPCTYTPPSPTSNPCTYTYSAWGTCQSDGTQTRTMLTASPAGCSGTPVLSQPCTYMPPSMMVTLSDVKTTCTACHGLTVNTTVLRSGGYTETGWSASQWLSTVNSMMNKGASLAAGTTAQDYANFLAALP